MLKLFLTILIIIAATPKPAHAMLELGLILPPAVIGEPNRCRSFGNPDGICPGDNVIGPGNKIFEVLSITGDGLCTLRTLFDPNLEKWFFRPRGFFNSPRDYIDRDFDFSNPRLIDKEVFFVFSGKKTVVLAAKLLSKARGFVEYDGQKIKLLSTVRLQNGKVADIRLIFENGKVLVEPLSFWLANVIFGSGVNSPSEEISYRQVLSLSEVTKLNALSSFKMKSTGRIPAGLSRLANSICAELLSKP